MSRNRTLACVFAHPDDDAYGVGLECLARSLGRDPVEQPGAEEIDDHRDDHHRKGPHRRLDRVTFGANHEVARDLRLPFRE